MPARPAKVFPVPPRAIAQAGHLRQAAGHQQGLGVVPAAHAVAAAGAQGHDVFQGGAQLHAHDIAAGVDPEVVVHEQVLDQLGAAFDPGRRTPRRWGHAAAHLLRVGGAGEGHHRAVVPGDFPSMIWLMRRERVPSRCPWTRTTRTVSGVEQVASPARRSTARAKDGVAMTTTAAALHAGQVSGEVQALRQRHPLQHGVLPGLAQAGGTPPP